MSNRNIDVIEHMGRYCDEIKEAQDRFGNSLESLKADSLYRNSVAMSILQIGELCSHLSEDFKALYNEMPWQDMKGMRNVAAHHYGKFDVIKLWETIDTDIPILKTYCIKILSENK